MMAVVVATTLVREAISKIVSGVMGRTCGADHPLAKGLAVDDLAVMTDHDDGPGDAPGGKLRRDNGVKSG